MRVESRVPCGYPFTFPKEEAEKIKKVKKFSFNFFEKKVKALKRQTKSIHFVSEENVFFFFQGKQKNKKEEHFSLIMNLFVYN